MTAKRLFIHTVFLFLLPVLVACVATIVQIVGD